MVRTKKKSLAGLDNNQAKVIIEELGFELKMNKGICRVCDVALTNENCYPSSFKYGINLCNPCDTKISAEKYKNNKLEIFAKLGGKCACCGVIDTNILTIDHIHGGGNSEKKILRGERFLVKLKNLPDLTTKYRCLCYNCNYCIGFWGKCQHEI